MIRDEALADRMGEAILADDDVLLESLLTRHPEYLRLNVGSRTWAHMAALHNAIKCLQCLVRLGLSVNEPCPIDPEIGWIDPEGPLYHAVVDENIEIIRWLLENGATPNILVDGVLRCTSLSCAVRTGRLDIVALLVDYGADVNATWEGRNALSNAGGRPEVERYLRSKGAKLPEELGGLQVKKPSKAANTKPKKP